MQIKNGEIWLYKDGIRFSDSDDTEYQLEYEELKPSSVIIKY